MTVANSTVLRITSIEQVRELNKEAIAAVKAKIDELNNLLDCYREDYQQLDDGNDIWLEGSESERQALRDKLRVIKTKMNDIQSQIDEQEAELHNLNYLY